MMHIHVDKVDVRFVTLQIMKLNHGDSIQKKMAMRMESIKEI